MAIPAHLAEIAEQPSLVSTPALNRSISSNTPSGAIGTGASEIRRSMTLPLCARAFRPRTAVLTLRAPPRGQECNQRPSLFLMRVSELPALADSS
ncbi:hypothetical protein RHECNPAF_1330051 [Rhizobium etli CNPAF512]|nr:hypothetical protein RHECNPAF_1330051 [Rhizobium etli CNPAF512]